MGYELPLPVLLWALNCLYSGLSDYLRNVTESVVLLRFDDKWLMGVGVWAPLYNDYDGWCLIGLPEWLGDWQRYELQLSVNVTAVHWQTTELWDGISTTCPFTKQWQWLTLEDYNIIRRVPEIYKNKLQTTFYITTDRKFANIIHLYVSFKREFALSEENSSSFLCFKDLCEIIANYTIT